MLKALRFVLVLVVLALGGQAHAISFKGKPQPWTYTRTDYSRTVYDWELKNGCETDSFEASRDTAVAKCVDAGFSVQVCRAAPATSVTLYSRFDNVSIWSCSLQVRISL